MEQSAISNKPTPGPWTFEKSPDRYKPDCETIDVVTDREGDEYAIALSIVDAFTGLSSEANARLIASAPTLAAEVETLRAEKARLEDLLCSACGAQTDPDWTPDRALAYTVAVTDRIERAERERDAMRVERDAALAKVAILRSCLNARGEHAEDCTKHQPSVNTSRCGCGLDAACAAAERAKGGG